VTVFVTTQVSYRNDNKITLCNFRFSRYNIPEDSHLQKPLSFLMNLSFPFFCFYSYYFSSYFIILFSFVYFFPSSSSSLHFFVFLLFFLIIFHLLPLLPLLSSFFFKLYFQGPSIGPTCRRSGAAHWRTAAEIMTVINSDDGSTYSPCCTVGASKSWLNECIYIRSLWSGRVRWTECNCTKQRSQTR
jgi:hypothetical protein